MIKLLFVALLGLATFLTCLAPARAENEIEIIQLKHRTADEVIPIIRPLLGPNDALSGTDYRLILRTSEKNRKEIDRVLAQIDVAPRRLRITVKQAVVIDRATTSHEVSGEVRLGSEGRLRVPPTSTGDNKGLVIGGPKPEDPRYQTKRITTASRDENAQTVTTMDGQRTYIRIGQSVPHVKKILALARNQVIITQGVELQNVTTGFEVLPRVEGQNIRLEIVPQLSTLENPATGLARFQELATTVTVKFGEWFDLGEIATANDEIQRVILESGVARSGERRTVLLKVE
jgi:type II secretory pathway component GspD/PulD (secretin)